jgi:insertion element IS1 protein InsB
VQVDAAEMDEMWSYTHDKSQQYWLWWAIDHNTGEPLAFVFGPQEQESLNELRKLLDANFSIDTIYADGNSVYDQIKDSWVIVSKQFTQKIERLHLSLRTWCSRLVRKGIRFSKSFLMHRIVVGMIINYWFFNNQIW